MDFYSANISSTQIYTSGWRHVQLLTTGVNLYTNGKQGKITLSNNSYTTTSASHKLCDLPSAYKPLNHHYIPVYGINSPMCYLELTAGDSKVMLMSDAMSSETWTLYNTLVYDLAIPL